MLGLAHLTVSHLDPQTFQKPKLISGTYTAYKNIPFYMTNRGYGVFFDHSDIISMEIQTEKLAKVQASVQGEQIRWFIINGPSPKQVSSEAIAARLRLTNFGHRC